MMINGKAYLVNIIKRISFHISRNQMKESLDFDYLFKYILVGDSSVGKSSLLSTFIKKTNNDDSQPTMGVEFATKKL